MNNIKTGKELLKEIVDNKKSLMELKFSNELTYDEAIKYLHSYLTNDLKETYDLYYELKFDLKNDTIDKIKSLANTNKDISILYAKALFDGEKVDKNLNEAITYFKKALDNKIYMGAYYLSLIYLSKEYFDEKLAKEYAEVAIKNNISDAYYTLAQLNDNEEIIFTYLDEGYKNDSVICSFEIGRFQFYNTNFKTAETYLKKAYELGSLEAGLLLARIYNNSNRFDDGGNIASNIMNKVNWNICWFTLTEAYFFKFKNDSEPAKEGFKTCKSLVENNYEEANYLYGCMLIDGFGCERDTKLGLEYLNKAINYFKNYNNPYGNLMINNAKKIISELTK